MANLKDTVVLGKLNVTDKVVADKIVKLGGTSNEVLCADGSTTTLSGLGAGTVTSVGVANGGGLSVSGSPITSSGTITISHADTSSQLSMTTGGRTYVNSITLDTYGHVTAIGTGTESNQDLSNYVQGPTSATDHAIARYDGGTGKKIQNSSGVTIDDNNKLKINATDTGGQSNVFQALSTSASDNSGNWIGRSLMGSKTLTFLMGTYNNMAGVGVHSWTDANAGSGAAWAPMYFQPDGGASAAIYMGQNGGGWTANTGTLIVKGSSTANAGTVDVNGTLTATAIKKSGSSDSYVLLGGGGHKALSEIGGSGGGGDVYGPSSSTDHAVVRFDGPTGKKIQDSSVTITDNGYLKIAANGNEVTIGSQNQSFCHIYNSVSIPFIFNNAVAVTGDNDLGTTAYKWGNLYLSGSLSNGTNSVSVANIVTTNTAQTISGNKVFTGTTSTMTLHTYSPLYINNGTDNSKNTSLYTDTDGVFKIVNSSSSVTRPTYNGKGIALTDDLTSLTNYVTLDTEQTISGKKTFTGSMKVSGRYIGRGDDEGIVIGRASNNYAGLCLGDPEGVRSVFYLTLTDEALWRYVNSSGTCDIKHPNKSGTIALTSDLSGYLPLAGGTMTGDINLGTNRGLVGTTSTGNRFDVFRVLNSTQLQVGGSYPELLLKGKNTRPTYNDSEMALMSDVNKKADDFSIEIYNGVSGNPRPVKFISVDYSSCNSENGVAIKFGMVSGHGNGSSYAFLQDVIIKVTHTGVITVDNFKYYGASTGTYEGANRQYGDIFWVNNTTNKVVDFYVLMGQYARVQMTPWKRVTYSSKGTVTQYSNATGYSVGTKEWGNNSEFALISDIPALPAIQVVSSLPSSTDPNTLYFITG